MENKYFAKINLSKINKNKITQREYTDKLGNKHKISELEIEMIPLKKEELVYKGEERFLWKIGFMTEKSVKNKNGEWINGNTLADIVMWKDKPKVEGMDIEYPIEETEGINLDNLDDLPF
jgi:hypothetical protein